MTQAEYELTRLDPNTFEHLVNSLALHVLGAGHTGFGPGPDGGRDGYFEGSSNYPSEKEAWSGVWYIQSKFHTANLSTNHGKWLLNQLEEELKSFSSGDTKRKWPDVFILATNIDPSGIPETGVFDRAKNIVKKYRPQLSERFHIWGGSKIINLLHQHENVSAQYGEFVTAGNVIRNIYKSLHDASAGTDDILRHFLVTDFQGQLYSKLEQAGSEEEDKPPLQDIFTDLPFLTGAKNSLTGRTLAKALAYPQGVPDDVENMDLWDRWQRDPERARIWFIKGGPGQGKSTITQFIAQVQRASLILAADGPSVNPKQKRHAKNIRAAASALELWPIAPRIPVTVELKAFAQWFGEQPEKATRLLTYIEYLLTRELGQTVRSGTLKRLFSSGRWLFIFDGLDEVPGDIKDQVAHEIVHFVDNLLVGLDCDASIVCTSRPQGYSGQFDAFQSANITLSKLSPEKALECAKPILSHRMSEKDSSAKIATLEQALSSPSVASLMTTPLQSHIMAIIVRIGGRPPERKWKLFDRFYEVIKKRETDKDFPDPKLNKLLSSKNKLIRALHNRLGFELHSRAETKSGATTALSRTDFNIIVRDVVESLEEIDIDETISTLMEAATERLVLVNTPENNDTVRFDIRQLQEFFAAEEISAAHPDVVSKRFHTIAGDSHWAEVVHFLLSGFVENDRLLEIASAVSSLLELDDGQTNSRDLHRRLARGGVITHALLTEGVLENDKRIRNQFRNCLSALLTTSDAASYLISVSGEQSRAWLIEVLLNALREKAEEESVGAATTLLSILGDDHPSKQAAFDLISEKSDEFKYAMLRDFYIRTDNEKPHGWVSLIALNLFKSSGWLSGEHEDITPVFSMILIAHREEGIFNGLFSEETSKAVENLFNYRNRLNRNTEPSETLCGGKIEIHHLGDSASDGWSNFSPLILSELSAAGGFFSAIAMACTYLQAPTPAAYQALFNIHPNLTWIRRLPTLISQSFNAEFIYSTPQEEDFSNFVSNTVNLRVLVRPTSDSFSEEDWVEIVQKIPGDFHHFVGYGERRIPDIVWSSHYLSDHVRKLDPGQLTTILGALPNPPPEGLRSAILEKIMEFGEKNAGSLIYERRTSPFELRLPSEAPILPWITNMLTERATMDLVLEDDSSAYEGIARVVRGYVPDAANFTNVMSNADISATGKAAAAILSAFHPDSPDLLGNYDWNQWYNPHDAPWLIPALCHAITPKIKMRDEPSIDKISSLFSLSRKDYAARSASAMVISGWREIAYQPVANSPKELWEVVKD